jgi:enoyl-CoA hydratase/carnithine racemase
MMTPLRIEIAGGVMMLTLDQSSRRNALSRELLDALRRALLRAAAEDLRAVVLTGGDEFFSAGADMAELQGSVADIRFDEALADIVTAIRGGSYLAIAAIEGPCIGAALDLVLACDARIASPRAFFELPALRLGLLYNPTAIARLWRTLPEATLKRLLLMGERIYGQEALAAGIVTHTVGEKQTLAAANEIAHAVCSFAPRALIETKRLLLALDDGSSDLTAWETVRREILASFDRQSALAAAKTQLQK